MISESAFTDNHFRRLADLNEEELQAEMAVISQWLVRDPRFPDHLLLVYVTPLEDGTIAAACECSEGVGNLPCLHALLVIHKIKDQAHLIRELFAPRESSAAA
jgi:hypothetical protein